MRTHTRICRVDVDTAWNVSLLSPAYDFIHTLTSSFAVLLLLGVLVVEYSKHFDV